MKKLTTLSILLISLAFVAPMQVSAIPIPPEPGPTSLSCEPSPLEIYHGDSAYFTVIITDNDSDDQIKIQNPKVRVSNTGEIKNKSRFSAKERESDNPESGDRTFEVSFTGGPVHDLNGTTEDTVTFEAIYQEASTKEGSLFVRDIKQSVSCLLIVTHSKKPTLTPSGGGIHPPEKSEDKNGQLRGGAGVKPGSFFYFFDTAFENIGLFFTFNPEKKAQKALEHADERLAEAEESAFENNPKAVEKAMTGYEEEISLATEKSKGLKDEKRAEELLNIVSENTAKHQEILNSVLEKVPEEAKQAILKAIEVSKKGQGEAVRQIAELKGEVERLKKEVAGLKAKGEEQGKVIEKLDKQKSEITTKPTPTPALTKPITPKTPETTSVPKSATAQSQAPTQTTEPQNTPSVPQTTITPAPTPTLVQTPIPTVSELVPIEISIQNQVCNLSQTNLKTEYQLYDLMQNGNTDGRIFMNAYILKNIGQNYYTSNPSAKMTITTSNHSNDKTINGSGNTGPCGYYYPYEFYATQIGIYTITYSIPEFNLSKTVILNIMGAEKPVIGSSGITVSTPQKETDYPLSELANLDSTSNVKYWFQTSKPNYRYSISAWCSDADTLSSKIDLVSHLEQDGLSYYRGYFRSSDKFSGTTSCKFLHSTDSSISSESDTITFSVK